MREAQMAELTRLESAIAEIDRRLGEGFARANPGLVAAVITADATVFGAQLIADALLTPEDEAPSPSRNGLGRSLLLPR
jgi:hypothetical protein